MNDYLENLAAEPAGKEEEVAESIEELVADYGLACFVRGLEKSSAADAASKVGQSSTLRCLSWILRDIVHAENPRLTAEVMAMGAGVLVNDDKTMTRMAEKWGVTRAAISKRVVTFCEEWNLPVSQFMKSERAREEYALTNKPKS